MELLRSPLLDQVSGLAHGFSTRKGGVSADVFGSLNVSGRVGDEREHVQANRETLLRALGRPAATFIAIHQVHGDTVVEVTRHASRTIEADALWTRDRDAALAVLVADCVPILIASETGSAVAAVHAGWRGTRTRIAARVVERLSTAGYTPDKLVVAIGPAIGPCCFEIGEDVFAEIGQAYPAAGEALRVLPDGKHVADLWALNCQALVEAGVRADKIDVLARCTACDAELFFSHRREQGKTGRQVGIIAPAPR